MSELAPSSPEVEHRPADSSPDVAEGDSTLEIDKGGAPDGDAPAQPEVAGGGGREVALREGGAADGDAPPRSETSESGTIYVRDQGGPADGDAPPRREQPDQAPPGADDGTRHQQFPTDRTSTGDAKLEGVWDRSEATQSGRSYVSEGDPCRQSAERISPTPGEYTVTCHANTEGFGVRNDDGSYTDVSSSEMSDLVRSDPDYHREPVRLVACETGKAPADGSDPVGQKMADNLGEPVTAPTELAWERNGEVWSSTAKDYTDPITGDTYKIPATGPENPDGEMKTFYPRTDQPTDR